MVGLLNEVCQHPQRYRVYEPPVRRILGRVFPFGVLNVAQPDRIWIVAIMHLKRRPGYWKRRLGGCRTRSGAVYGFGAGPSMDRSLFCCARVALDIGSGYSNNNDD